MARNIEIKARIAHADALLHRGGQIAIDLLARAQARQNLP